MENKEGDMVDLYIPRKCTWTNRIITAKDHAAVQINVGEVNPATGTYTRTYKSYALCGYIRQKGESDMALTALVAKDAAAAL
eukprot:CAMPEP_0116957208 /NCGR_PEP_ID=MMETSP0467-20121206/43826_1 /TAXON_ID=283647 /ORGANISM="Mesodinium pulex, Strain SPMC105" /LENGTH=81 /DNA_ID=CAMNT_0004643897 /DNA_START=40 /DNA_END=285 /DNA_ORIENTATION=+